MHENSRVRGMKALNSTERIIIFVFLSPFNKNAYIQVHLLGNLYTNTVKDCHNPQSNKYTHAQIAQPQYIITNIKKVAFALIYIIFIYNNTSHIYKLLLRHFCGLFTRIRISKYMKIPQQCLCNLRNSRHCYVCVFFSAHNDLNALCALVSTYTYR